MSFSEELQSKGIVRGCAVTWTSPVQKRFGCFIEVAPDPHTAKPMAQVIASNGTLYLDPSTIELSDVGDPIHEDLRETYGK